MNKSNKDWWVDMRDKAKASWHWEAATAGLNLQMNLYNLRKRAGYTQRSLGNILGVAQPHIVRHESWGYMPSMDSLAKYAHLYGITIAELLGSPRQFEPSPFSSSAQTITINTEWPKL